MKFIQLYESFSNDTLYIFDFDETLARTPSFEELAVEYLKEDVTIKSLLKKSVDMIDSEIKDIKWENGRLYIQDPEKKINVCGNWIRKNNRVYLLTPHKFPFTNISLPKSTKPLSKMYRKVENKCIVTARPSDMRKKIERTMKSLGLEMPRFGLHMFPSGKGSGNPGLWKGRKIVELIKETGFKKAHFYDDNSKVVNRVEKIVKESLPEIEFKVTKVK
jgi:hypothetical protein